MEMVVTHGSFFFAFASHYKIQSKNERASVHKSQEECEDGNSSLGLQFNSLSRGRKPNSLGFSFPAM